MKKIIKKLGLLLAAAVAIVAINANSAAAVTMESISQMDNPALEGANAVKANGMPDHLIGDTGIFTRLANTLLYIVGIITVIMLVIGGFKYIISGGDGKKISDAKNTILYAIVGLIIIVLAYSVVNFILSAITGMGIDA